MKYRDTIYQENISCEPLSLSHEKVYVETGKARGENQGVSVGLTSVRLPLLGPHVLMYPTPRPPKNVPKITHSAASVKLSFITSVPKDPVTILLIAIPMLNHVSIIRKGVELVFFSRSSRDTGSIPRASKPLMFLAHRSYLDPHVGGGVPRVCEASSCSRVTLRKEGDLCLFSRSESMLVRACLSRELSVHTFAFCNNLNYNLLGLIKL